MSVTGPLSVLNIDHLLVENINPSYSDTARSIWRNSVRGGGGGRGETGSKAGHAKVVQQLENSQESKKTIGLLQHEMDGVCSTTSLS